jgi:TolB-like protein/class 3 adenylate cyclase/Tfp pilus assembly protein PilF
MRPGCGGTSIRPRRLADVGGFLTGERVTRRLAAILAADVVGYSRLMGRDELGTLARLKAHRAKRLEPTLARHGGRLVKLTGDGALVEFPSAVDALGAAIEFQQTMAEANRSQPEDTAIVFRIGLHLGDLIVDGDDLYGDGVNVAARLEAEAPAGGIVLSGNVHDAVVGRLQAAFEDLGDLSLKNIERPVRGYRVRAEGIVASPAVVSSLPTDAPLALPDKPSIAVLPFQNMSGDPEQEYFVDGLVEEVITALSRNKNLFVIARNSSFLYKGRSPDIRQVGRELGVLYVLEGSIRKSGNRIRITGQLIEAMSGTHIWADRFDGDLQDVFELQDQLTASVVGGIMPTLHRAEIERTKRKTSNLAAYDYYLRSRDAAARFSAEDNGVALDFARKAAALDPDWALGHATIAFLHNQRRSFGWPINRSSKEEDDEEAAHAARRALDLDSYDAQILTFCGQTLVMTLRRLEEGAAYLERAVNINPNFALGLTYRASSRIARDMPESAIDDLERALRLSPIDGGRFYTLTLLARAHTLCGHPEKAIAPVGESLRVRPNFPATLIDAIVAHALAGDIGSARTLLAAYTATRPSARIATFKATTPHLSAGGLDKYADGLRLAGLPE